MIYETLPCACLSLRLSSGYTGENFSYSVSRLARENAK